MKIPSKELIIAVLIGFGVGLVVTYGIWTANQAIKQKESSISPIPTEAVRSNGVNEIVPVDAINKLQLTVAQPEPNTMTDLDILSVTGVTMADANVFVFGERDWELVIADNQGQFNTEIQLIRGVNFIKVTTVSDEGKQVSVGRTVVYSTTEI